MDLQKGGGGEERGVGQGWEVEVITWGPTLHLEDSGLGGKGGEGVYMYILVVVVVVVVVGRVELGLG